VIERELAPYLLRLFGQYPMVAVVGPRQSALTALCRSTFAELACANFEDPEAR